MRVSASGTSSFSRIRFCGAIYPVGQHLLDFLAQMNLVASMLSQSRHTR